MPRLGRTLIVLLPLLGLVAAIGARYATASRSDTGTLTFKAALDVRYPPTDCPAGTAETVACFARTGSATIRGLGSVVESYPYLVESAAAGCGADQVRVPPATVHFRVADKGEIELRLAGSACLTRIPPNPVQGEEPFTITGGSGEYSGASGAGTIDHESEGPPNWRGTDTWSGTLVVPGLDFDLTRPTISGAVNRTVRAPRGTKTAVVRFTVTARDAVDGARPVLCKPRSGSRFKLGKTPVTCTAADTSGNVGAMRFTVMIRATP